MRSSRLVIDAMRVLPKAGISRLAGRVATARLPRPLLAAGIRAFGGLFGVDFSEVVTAQQVRSYKPAHRHFHEVLDRLDLPRNRVLHVAQSLYHDIAPARELGIACVWVNRRAGRAGSGATKASAARPDHEVPDLRTLVRELGL